MYYIIILIQNKKKLKEDLKHISYLSIFLLIFSSWFWGPLLRDLLFIGFESHQNRYFHSSILTFPLLRYFETTYFGVIYVIGAIFIMKKYSNLHDIKILGNLLISISFLFLLGLIGILIGFPIMHIRFLYVSFYILIISATIFYVKFFHFIAKNDKIRIQNFQLNLKQVEIFLIICFLFFQYTNYAIVITETPYYDYTIDEDYPANLIDIFKELDYEDKVFLTTKYRVAAFIPIYCFLLPIPYYSHPSSLYNERVRFLVELSECEDSKSFHKKVTKNEFEPIDYFFLDFEKNDTILVFEVAIERFIEGREYYEIKFDRTLFQDPDLFEEITIEDKIIYETIY